MHIIGQTKLIQKIDKLISTDNLPRYIIIQGATGACKHLIASYIAHKLNALLVPSDISVDAVREVIDLSYELTEPTVYLWADVQKMSLAAKNAILKVTEEPPQQAYFIMTVDSTTNLLNTLVSRGYVLDILPYTVDELLEFANYKYPDMKDKTKNLIVDLSNNIGDVIKLSSMDIEKLNSIVDMLCNNIGKVNLANELKIPTFLKFKSTDDDDKIDPLIFMKSVMIKLSDCMIKSYNMFYADLINLTSQYIADMNSKSLNKTAVVDNWILQMHLMANGGNI